MNSIDFQGENYELTEGRLTFMTAYPKAQITLVLDKEQAEKCYKLLFEKPE